MARGPAKSRHASKADREFISEAEDILERMRSDLVDLDDQRAGSEEVEPDVVNRLFRSAHSLKALAGLFGFDSVRTLANQLEDVLDGLRLGRISLESASVPMIAEAVELLSAVLGAVGDAQAMETAAAPIAGLAGRIEAEVQQSAPGPGDFDALEIDPTILRALTEYEEHRLRESLRRGRHIALVEAPFEISSFEEGLSQLREVIRSVGELISTLPAAGDASASQIRFSLLVASPLQAGELTARIDLPGVSVRQVAAGREAPAPSLGSSPTTRDRGDPPSLQSISDTVRVEIRKLDDLMNLVGELVIHRGAAGDLIALLQSNASTAWIANDFSKSHRELERMLKDLQSAVLDLRMVPMRQIFEKLSRVVRTLRRELGKDVRFEVRGADTELDKLIVEQLVDPLNHVVRNAIDHAIESPERRAALGKEPQGRIEIEARQRGTQVVISVSDDGAGIDTAGLCARAKAAGLIGENEVLSRKEALELIFAPGLSTRVDVTDTSGRGVGMDVVRTNLTAIGGVVDVESTPGSGTVISMTLPITLAIMQSLIVCVAGQRFAIPLAAVQETLLVDPSTIQRGQDRELLDLRGDALLLRRLSEEFELEAARPGAKLFVVVVGLGETRIGLLVDQLEGQQDTVVKPIQGPFRAMRGIVGATEIGDREPVLVLDVASLIDDSARRREAA